MPPPHPQRLGDLPASCPDLPGLHLLVGRGVSRPFPFLGFLQKYSVYAQDYLQTSPLLHRGAGGGGTQIIFRTPQHPQTWLVFFFGRGGSSGAEGRGEPRRGRAEPFRSRCRCPDQNPDGFGAVTEPPRSHPEPQRAAESAAGCGRKRSERDEAAGGREQGEKRQEEGSSIAQRACPKTPPGAPCCSPGWCPPPRIAFSAQFAPNGPKRPQTKAALLAGCRLTLAAGLSAPCGSQQRARGLAE